MKKELRKETKVGLICFVVFNILNYIAIETGSELPLLHFCTAGFIGLSISFLIVGLLPENVYTKVKNIKG